MILSLRMGMKAQKEETETSAEGAEILSATTVGEDKPLNSEVKSCTLKMKLTAK